jgi:hypothetical protein
MRARTPVVAREAIDRAVMDAGDETGRFIREQLGDAKLSAVDPPARRAKRIQFLQRHR